MEIAPSSRRTKEGSRHLIVHLADLRCLRHEPLQMHLQEYHLRHHKVASVRWRHALRILFLQLELQRASEVNKKQKQKKQQDKKTTKQHELNNIIYFNVVVFCFCFRCCDICGKCVECWQEVHHAVTCFQGAEYWRKTGALSFYLYV